jgi:hypothetical protein
MELVETIRHNETTYGIIVRAEYNRAGISFFTPDEFSQQLGFMRHPAGKAIEPHVHRPITRTVHFTKEVLILRKGRLRIDFYANEGQYLESCILNAGDIVLLSEGGHGFRVIEDVEMFEVKQGPYAGDQDKEHIDAVSESRIVLREA